MLQTAETEQSAFLDHEPHKADEMLLEGKLSKLNTLFPFLSKKKSKEI